MYFQSVDKESIIHATAGVIKDQDECHLGNPQKDLTEETFSLPYHASFLYFYIASVKKSENLPT